MDLDGRYNHIEDVLVQLHLGQWFGWSNSKNKIYENLVIHNSDYVKPTETELINALIKQNSDFDSQDYVRNREVEYPTIKDLVVALYDTNDKSVIDAKRAAVKLKYPKPE